MGSKDGNFPFYALLAILSVAVLTVIFSAVHILSWGLQLAVPENLGAQTEKIRNDLRKLSEDSYSFLVLIFILVVLYVPLLPVFWGISALLVKGLHAPLLLAGTIAGLIITIPLAWASWRIVTDSMESRQWLWSQARLLNILVISLCIVFLAEKELACTVEIRMSDQTFSQSEPKSIEILTTLGGATSEPSLAVLTLKDSSGSILKKLEKLDLGNGEYVSFTTARNLAPGRYQVVLEYPHSSFTDEFPYAQLKTVKTSWFVVLP